ncbi:MAG: hypothetical protein M3268_08185, partial [Acidobacteriota bacterium]|nr:hypothetical protein [Acidobacteriota bacterium]
LQYIERLRALPLSTKDGTIRASLPLDMLILFYNAPIFLVSSDSAEAARYQKTQPPGPEVMRAYVAYMLDSIADMERREPGSAQRMRYRLGTISNLLRSYAPEMTPAFNELERLSRRPGDSSPLPTLESSMENSQKDYERRVKDAMASDHPDELMIERIIGHGDFDKARKLIAKLDDGPKKDQLTQSLDAREALALLAKGDALAAEQIAERLRNVAFVLQVYPPLVRACVAAKDEACPSRLVHKAVRQIKGADTSPLIPPPDIPAYAFPSKRELDRVLMSLSQLAAQVAPASDALALEMLEEIVEAANRSELDTGQGRTGFDSEVFRLVAARNEDRARQAAEDFKDRLRQIVALAAIDQAKVGELNKRPKGRGEAAKQDR